jgi:predicted porin
MKTRTYRYRGIAVASCLACAAAVAHAEPTVTIYGVADAYLAFQKGDRSEVKVDSGGMAGSRLGFSATQELGKGTQAIAKFEAGIGADTGTSNQNGITWGRLTWVGLTGSLGTLTLGRQYTPTFVAVDTDDPFDTGAGSAASSGIVSILGGARANNSIAYELPKFGGVTVDTMYAAGESTIGSAQNKSFFGASARYASGPLGAGITYAHLNRSDDGGVAAYSLLVSGTYDFGAVKLMGGVQGVRNSTLKANAADDRVEYYAGVHVPFGEDALWLGAGTGSIRHLGNSRATQLSVGYLHSLFKNTTLYGVATTISNDANAAYTTDTATGAGPAVSQGKDASALQVGMMYRF